MRCDSSISSGHIVNGFHISACVGQLVEKLGGWTSLSRPQVVMLKPLTALIKKGIA